MGFSVFEAGIHLVIMDSTSQAYYSENEEQVAPNEHLTLCNLSLTARSSVTGRKQISPLGWAA